MRLTRSTLIPLSTAKVSTYMARLGAIAPRTRYLGKVVQADQDGKPDQGVVRTLCSFLTPSGFERELEIPVIMHRGEILEPTVAMVRGNPVILSKELVASIGAAGTITEKVPPGHIYSTAYIADPNLYRELCESIEPRPRLYRPLY